MISRTTRRALSWLAVISAAAALAAAVTLPASGSTGPAPGGGHLHHGCAPHALTRQHESLLQFDRKASTYPAAVAGETWNCDYGFEPPSLLAYFDAGHWNRPLPPHVRLYFAFPIADQPGA